MNCKAKGSRIERKAKAQLERQGFQLVVKSGASLGLFDLIAVGVDFDHALLVQVKANRMPGKAEMDRLKAFQVPCFCRKEIWIFKDYAKEPTSGQST
ncbi:MAG: hypothetical protein ACM3SR_09315 [Ignavibacteriales bacterium]